MNRICWRLVDSLAKMLDPHEAEAVRGDLAEARETSFQTLRGMLGLVARRQAAVWKDWRPWLSLVLLIVPLAMLLSIASSTTAGLSSVYVWMYANNWDSAFLNNISFWYVLRDSTFFVFTQYLTLACWSWAAGFLLGSVSRRIVQVNGILFCLMLAFGAFTRVHMHQPAPTDPNGPVFALAFYRELFPLILLVVLVIVPALYAMRRSVSTRTRRLRFALCAAAIASLIAMTIHQPGLLFLVHAPQLRGILHALETSLPHFLLYWPVAFLIADTIRLSALAHRRPGNIPSTPVK